MNKMKIILVAGARPNFMKISPIVRALKARDDRNLEWKIIHTGQHYDFEMSQAFFDDLDIPMPDYSLESGSGSHASQTAAIMTAFEDVCLVEKPDVIVVVGDVNSTLACSIVGKKLLTRVAHVEAGLRSFDLSMPEEINRMVTDSISDYFFITEKSARENLLKEGKPSEKIYFVGHVMIDNLLYQLKRLESEDHSLFPTYDIKKNLNDYVFITLHRPSNVDDRKTLEGIFDALNHISSDVPVVFPVHPRTKKMLDKFNIRLSERIVILPPLGFKESLFLWKDAVLVLTDSGGLQEETTGLGIPCFTIRENTERPITVEIGTNMLVGSSCAGILATYNRFKGGARKTGEIPEFWDGKAAERIVGVLIKSRD